MTDGTIIGYFMKCFCGRIKTYELIANGKYRSYCECGEIDFMENKLK